MKYLVGLILGVVLHMGYLDYAIIQSLTNMDACYTTAKGLGVDEAADDICGTLQRETLRHYKGKYFNLVRLISFKTIGKLPWSME